MAVDMGSHLNMTPLQTGSSLSAVAQRQEGKETSQPLGHHSPMVKNEIQYLLLAGSALILVKETQERRGIEDTRDSTAL